MPMCALCLIGAFTEQNYKNWKQFTTWQYDAPRDAQGAFTEQNYKNWKQFTTQCSAIGCFHPVLLLNKITKIESNSQPFRKAIFERWKVLLLNKITKIESNSQQNYRSYLFVNWCFYWTKLQKLKAIHNKNASWPILVIGAFTEQNYKNWKQFTTAIAIIALPTLVLLLNKITKIESNSQQP